MATHRGNVVAREGIRRVRYEKRALADSAVADDDHLQVHHESKSESESEDGARWEAIAVLHEVLARETELEITVPRPPNAWEFAGSSLRAGSLVA